MPSGASPKRERQDEHVKQRQKRPGRSHRTERREVRVDDPALSDRANERLTEEVREVVGADSVEVPRERGRGSERKSARRSELAVAVSNERVMIATIGGTLVMAGAVATLATGSWWFLALALGAHALVTIAVVGIALVTMRGGEHASPTTVAELQEEGVTDPDRRLSEAAEEFRSARSARDAAG